MPIRRMQGLFDPEGAYDDRSPFQLANLPDEAVVAPGEVGLLVGRSVETLRRWRRDGRGPSYLKAAARDDQAEYMLGDVRQ
jgi:hypothetical protein